MTAPEDEHSSAAAYREVALPKGVRLSYAPTSARQNAGPRQLLTMSVLFLLCAFGLLWSTFTGAISPTMSVDVPVAALIGLLGAWFGWCAYCAWTPALVDVDAVARRIRVRTPRSFGLLPRTTSIAFDAIDRFEVGKNDRVQAVRADGSVFEVVDFDHRLSHRKAVALAERLRVLVGEIDGRDRPQLRVDDPTHHAPARRVRIDEPRDRRGWDEAEPAAEDDARATRRR